MTHGYDFFWLNDIPAEELVKTEDVRLPWTPEPDTTSEFHRIHSADNVTQMYEESWTHRKCREPVRLEKRVTLAKNYYLKSMRQWIATGEDIQSFILGSHESIREELRNLARQEGLL